MNFCFASGFGGALPDSTRPTSMSYRRAARRSLSVRRVTTTTPSPARTSHIASDGLGWLDATFVADILRNFIGWFDTGIRFAGCVLNDTFAKIWLILGSSVVVQFTTIGESCWRRWLHRNVQHVRCFIDFDTFNQVRRVSRTDKLADVG